MAIDVAHAGQALTEGGVASSPPREGQRVFTNLLLHIVNHGVVAPIVLAPLARLAALRDSWTLARVPTVLAVPLAFVLHELAVYWIHRAMHASRRLKTIHRLHHEGTRPRWHDAFRVHPVEFALTLFAGNTAALLTLGSAAFPPLIVVLALRAVGAWLHSDPEAGLGRLEFVLASPRVHALHHRDARFNFAGTLACFDRLFGTFRAARGSSGGAKHKPASRGLTAKRLAALN